MKKLQQRLIGMTFVTVALLAISIFILTSKHSVGAVAASTASTAAQTMNMPVNIFALTTDNTLYVLPAGYNYYYSLGKITGITGYDVIGIDFRPADRKLYALTDGGRLYTVDYTVSPPSATLVSSLSPRFSSGFQSLMDFNPQVDAIRLIGSNTLNYAVVKDAAGILNTTAAQTSLTYAAGDVNAGKVPSVSAGAYTNNVAGATSTIFYGLDADLDTFVTIADKTAAGSSNTGGGKLKTIGNLVDANNNPITVNQVADIDIATIGGVDYLIGVSRAITFDIPLSQINQNLPLGTTQNVVVRAYNFPTSPTITSSFIDIAVSIP